MFLAWGAPDSASGRRRRGEDADGVLAVVAAQALDFVEDLGAFPPACGCVVTLAHQGEVLSPARP